MNNTTSQDLASQAKALLSICRDSSANMANLSALIFNSLPNLNWAGFYIIKGGQLVVGPFQGKPACVLINIGKGVCGAAAQKGETIIVEDVHEFPGHIACDCASNSEIVVPIFTKLGTLYGILDIDSPLIGRFGTVEKQLFEELATIFVESSDL